MTEDIKRFETIAIGKCGYGEEWNK